MGQAENEAIRIVISYRRLDSAGHAGHLHADLLARFGSEHVFRDIDSIEPGRNFKEVIEDAIVGSDVLIALVGREWASATDEQGRRRLEREDDPVRFELELGMRGDVRVVPVLVQGARMPPAASVPPSLAGFCDLHAFEISDRRWGDDVDDLARFLERLAREKAQRLADPDAGTLAEERRRQAAAGRDVARRREDAVLQQSLREEVERRRLRERDLTAELAARDRRIAHWRRSATVAAGVVAGLALLGLVVTLVPGGGETGRTVAVSARTMWTDTGLDVERGQRVSIVATGTIDTHQPDPGRRSGPGGRVGEEDVPANIVRDIGHGALIRRIGDGPPRGAGASADFRAEESGRLYLGVNDWNFETNAGAFSATVKLG